MKTLPARTAILALPLLLAACAHPAAPDLSTPQNAGSEMRAASLAPTITSVSPTTAVKTGLLTLSGTNFGYKFRNIPAPTSAFVTIGGVAVTPASYVSWSPTQIVVRTSAATPLVRGGYASVRVTVGDQKSNAVPVRLVTPRVRSIAAGRNNSLAVRKDGTVAAWGHNASFADEGQLDVPAGLSNVVAVSNNSYSSLALKGDGTVVAWGMVGTWGVDRVKASVPEGLSHVIAVSTGADALALKSDGTVVAWDVQGAIPLKVPAGLSNVVAVSARNENLALKSDGTVVAWGYDGSGPLNVPAGLSNVVAVAAGVHHNLALKSDGTVVAWGTVNGNTDYGQLNVPTGLSNVVAVAAGISYSLALKSDGTVVTWGQHPPLFQGLHNIIAVDTAGWHTLALKSDGTVVQLNTGPWAKEVPAGLSVMLP